MLLAILEDAIDQILTIGLAHRDAPIRSEPERWIFSNDRKRPFSFVNVCETLKLDPDWVRDKIRAELRKRQRRAPLFRSPKDAAGGDPS